VVEPTGGLFVSLQEDPPAFADEFRASCEAAEIPVEELDPETVRRDEPHLSPTIQRAFAVPDATINPWGLVTALCDDARALGGEILTRHQVTGFELAGGRIRAVRVAGGGSERTLEADCVVNAAGPWAARVAFLADQTVDLELTKGSILVFAHRFVSKAINRCRPSTSHDIMVPTGTVSLFGTTSEVVDDPDTTRVNPEEIQSLLEGGEAMIPGLRSYRAFRAWAGVRPLLKPADWSQGKPLPRRHKVINHAPLGLSGFFTLCGGSLTTHRAMAEDLGNQVCHHFRAIAPCRTATTPLASHRNTSHWRPAESFESIEAENRRDSGICECESVSQSDLDALISEGGYGLHDLRRRLRIGFGPCQGTFCAGRVAGLLAEADPGFPAEEALARFWSERLKGMTRTAWGDQARQVLLSDLVFREVMGLRLRPEILPSEDRR
jgi:glycerol-3-phosphate dehydrogenase